MNLKSRGREVVAVFDAHDPGISDAVWSCPKKCGWVGTENDWYAHLAGKLAEFLEGGSP